MNARPRAGGSAMMHGEVQMFTTTGRGLNSRTADSMVAAQSVSPSETRGQRRGY